MTTRKRRTTKRTPKRSNSNIQSAQQAADKERAARVLEVEKQKAKATGGAGQTKLSARTGPMATRDAGVDPNAIAARDKQNPFQSNGTPMGMPNRYATSKQPGDASAPSGLLAGLNSVGSGQSATEKPNPLADASLYGANTQARADRLTALFNAKNNAKFTQLKTAGKAVWMGYTHNRVKLRNQGPERMDENGNDTTTVAAGDDVRSTDELMSWLADEKTFNQIKTAAQKAGMQVQSYDDVAKLWQSVVSQAASTYSTTGKKVTPWALLSLRGKTMVNGRPAAKTTVSTNIDEMDPAQAKVMIKNTLSQELGRDPKQSEIDDFISKAQMIAKENPQVTTTTTQYDFAGDPASQTSHSTGGTDAVNAKAQLEAEQMAKDAPDYAQYQSAGVMMPWLDEALASPF